MKTAVVMATYDGESYLKEQLISLRDQEKKADKVYIWDDCSTDDTVPIIRNFVTENNLSDYWQLKINENNQGWMKNFHNALLQAKEDIIFLCDQDDIWFPEKIRKMTQVMEGNSAINLLASSYIPYYETARKISPKIIATMKYDGKIKKIPTDEKFHIVLRPGCTYAVRRSFLEAIKDVWVNDIAHDMNIWTIALLRNEAYFFDEALIKWRRYDNSSSSPLRDLEQKGSAKRLYNLSIEETKKRIFYYNIVLEYCKKNPRFFSEKSYKYLITELSRCHHILSAFKEKSIKKLFCTYIKFKSSYLSIRTLCSDICIIINSIIKTQK